MKLQPASLPWLVAHNLTLSWRGFAAMFGRLPRWAVIALCLTGLVMLHLVAWPVARWLVLPRLGAGGNSPAMTAVAFAVLAWMAAQGLLNMARTLQDRGGLDLQLASPLPLGAVLASILISIAAGSFASVALLVLPLADVLTLLDGPAWLGVHVTLVAMALIGTVAGVSVAIALFLAFEPRRARFIAQLCAAFIGGAFLLAVQVAAMLPPEMQTALGAWVGNSYLAQALQPLAAAARGDVASVAGVLAAAVLLFWLAAARLGSAFLRANLRAAGAAADAGGSLADGPRTSQFGLGAGSSLRRKEWRLLRRDHGVFAQLSLQIIYTVPLAVVLLKGAENLPLAAALAPTFVVIAAQVSASLAWITVSGEDAPELIASAPVRRSDVEIAKVSAIGVPVLLILGLPLLGMTLLFPGIALLVAIFAAAAATSTALLNLWHPMPGNRRGMLRRHSQSKLMALVEHLLAMLWAVAMVLALVGTPWALVPVGLVCMVLALSRYSAARA